jgi:glycosyltransferase involved in cell wall biosynthesis
MEEFSVLIPVKDGGSMLERVVAAVQAQGNVELIVIDSGSRDHSVEIARAAGAEVIEIAPSEFGHGKTRNLGAQCSTGQLICFLTQDAVPEPGWLDAYREAFAMDPRVGAAYGPHLPLSGTSPMIARELTDFFAGFSPDGGVALQREGDPAFLSNVNACYRRSCWAQVRFPEIDYAEDQAFGEAMLAAGWMKAFHPGAAVRHAHDYGPVEFMKRYFDEYRGLRQASGHVEPIRPTAAWREVRADGRWMREHNWAAARRARWMTRSALHHSTRQAASALGSRADRLPTRLQKALSLEGRGAPTASLPANGPVARGKPIPAHPGCGPYPEILRLSREGPAPLEDVPPGLADQPTLHFAIVIPPFQRGSGGHNTIFTLIARLEEMGHTCSIWMYDPYGRHSEQPSVLRRRIVQGFQPVRAPVFKGFADWYGADVAVATGWDTAYQVALLPRCRARAYLINDHEPDFFAASADSLWAAHTYELELFAISASRWLRGKLARQYGQQGTWFRLGVDHLTYHQRQVKRRGDTVMFYAREFTPRRAVPLGVLALEELHARLPDTRFVLFGQSETLKLAFPYELVGIVNPEQLAWYYSEATVGLCLSLTNYSLIPQEMMACGLPCVDLAGGSAESEFGRDGPVQLAEADPTALADALESLLTNESLRRRRSQAGLDFVKTASWDVATKQVEAGLREALREREPAIR